LHHLSFSINAAGLRKIARTSARGIVLSNRVNPSTTIRFALPQREHVTLKVFEVNGREVARLVDGNLAAGNHAVTFAPREITTAFIFIKSLRVNFRKRARRF